MCGVEDIEDTQKAARRRSGADGTPEVVTDEQRWLVVGGRRWRRQDPAVPEAVVAELLSHLGRGRSGVRRANAAEQDPAPHRQRVDLAKHGLGERGQPWWEQSAQERRARWEEAVDRLRQLDDRPADT